MPTGQYQRKPRVERVENICEVCGKVTMITPGMMRSRMNANPSGKVRFCSTECSGVALSNPDAYTSLSCPVCGKDFLKRRDHVRPNRCNYCSKECQSEARRVPDAKWRDPEQIKTYMRSYLAANKDRHNELNRLRNKAKPELRKAVGRRFREAHLADITVKRHTRRKSYQCGDLTSKEWDAIKNEFCNCCVACGVPGKDSPLTIDHVIPLSAGGAHTADNVQPLCKSCNSRKHTKTIDYRPQAARMTMDDSNVVNGQEGDCTATTRAVEG